MDADEGTGETADDAPAIESLEESGARAPEQGRVVWSRIGVGVEPSLPAPDVAGMTVHGLLEARFRRHVGVRVRLLPTGVLRYAGAAHGLGVATVGVGYARERFAFTVGGGFGQVARRTHEYSEPLTSFGLGGFGTASVRVGDVDSFGLDVDAAVGRLDEDGPVGVAFDVDLALRFPAGRRGVLVLRGEGGWLMPFSTRIGAEGRVRVRGDGGPRSLFVVAGAGYQWLTPDGSSNALGTSGITLSLGAEARLGSGHARERPSPRMRSATERSESERLTMRARRLRIAGGVMLAYGAASALTGGLLVGRGSTQGSLVAGSCLLGAAAFPAFITAAGVFPAAAHRARRAERLDRRRGAWQPRP